jgi:hypothetical protein
MSLWRIECFCDENKVTKVLASLTGVGVRGVPAAQPVGNADAAPKGKIKVRNGALMEHFEGFLRKKKLKVVDVAILREFIKANGMSEHSANYFSQKARDAGLLKKVDAKSKSDTTYAVTLPRKARRAKK